LERPDEMGEVIRVRGKVWKQLVCGTRITPIEHGIRPWDIHVNVVAEVQIHEMASKEPRYDKETKSSVAGSFVTEIS